MLLVRKTKRGTSGFSLIELIAASIILALLAGGAAIGITRWIKKAKVNAAKSEIATFEQAISLFQMECGFFPSDLDELVRAPSSGRTCKDYPEEGFLKKKEIPQDPWNATYNFTKPGLHNTGSYDLWSNGADGEEGTADDVTNWASEGESQDTAE